MKKLYKVKILEANIPTKQHHIYNEETIQLIQKQLEQLKYVTLGQTDPNIGTIKLDNIAAKIINSYQENNSVYVDIEFLDTVNGEIAEELCDNNSFTILPCGIGTVDKNGNVTNYNLLGLSFNITY